MAFFDAARWLLITATAAVLLSPDRAAELLTVLAHGRGGRLQSNADGTALVDEDALCGDPPATSSGVNIDAIGIHLDMRDPKANKRRACARNIQTQRLCRKRLSIGPAAFAV
jgi:hypothetical protein